MRTIPIPVKAQQAVDEGLVLQLDGPYWEVTSLTDPETVYEVTFQNCGGTCSCRGFRFRSWCYHIEAVKMSQPKPINQSVRIEEELL